MLPCAAAMPVLGCSTSPEVRCVRATRSPRSLFAWQARKSTRVPYPVAISKKCCCPACWKRNRASSSSMSPRAASTSAPSPRSIESSTNWLDPALASSSSRANYRKSSASPTACSSCAKANSPASLAAIPERRSRRKPSSNWQRAPDPRSTRQLDPYTEQIRRHEYLEDDMRNSLKRQEAGTPPVEGTTNPVQRQANILRHERMQALMRTAGMLPILILLCIGFGITTGNFFSLQNLSIVTQQASINVVLAAGMTFVILTGGIDLSVGSVLSAAAVAALLASNIPGFGGLAVPVALAVGAGFGLINGALISLLRLPPFIVTLGSLTAVRGIARLMGHDTTIFNPQLSFAFIGNESVLGIPWLVIIAIAVVAISWFILRRTVLGLRIYFVGGNPEAARLSGIRVWGIEMFVYVISGFLAGLGAVMSAARLYAANGLQMGQS